VAEPEPEEEHELTVPIKTLKSQTTAAQFRAKPSEFPKDKPTDRKSPVIEDLGQPLPRPEPPSQPIVSPTKSILLTPGTAVGRRKTVSFGDGVVDNERRRGSPRASPRKQALTGTISRQWPAHPADGTRKNRSKLTQTLLEAREKKAIPVEDELFDIGERKQQAAPPEKAIAREPAVKNQIEVDVQAEVAQLEEEDVTTNLEDPRSQSGIYWKSEFESYRAKTNQEIKKLIQYRSIAKSYAKSKEAEASRLADKLRRYEGKVDQFERNVSQLAAGMASDQDANAEGIVKELSKQTALVLRYKHQVDSLKKALERHGVFEDGVQSAASERSDLVIKLRETEEALERANSEPMSVDQESDMKEMERLVAASEERANELEKENLALKRNLAKAKEEMSKYEDRRKAKESKLKEREQKLKSRVEAYSAELRGARKRHKDVEEQLRSSFAAEKKQLQDTITELRQKLLADQAGAQSSGTKPEGQQRQSSEGTIFRPKISSLMDEDLGPDDSGAEDDTEFALPRQKTVREYQNSAPLPDECTETDLDLMTFDESTPKKPKASVQAYRDKPIPPSSPPLQGDDTFPMLPNIPKHLARPAAPAPSPRPSMVYMSLTSRNSGDTSRQRNKADAMTKASRMNRQLSLAADANVLPSSDSAGSVAAAKLESLSAERVAAAKARLKQKQLEAKGIGKENVALLG
jgi:hypothetical protein